MNKERPILALYAHEINKTIKYRFWEQLYFVEVGLWKW